MKRSLFILAALTFSFVFATAASLQATPPKHGPVQKKPMPQVQNQKQNHQQFQSHKINHSVRFHVRSYCNWRSYCYLPRYSCYCFYDATCQGWFYWCEPAGRFLPIETIAMNVPTTNGAPLLPPGAVPVQGAPVAPAAPMPTAPMIPAPVENQP